MIFNESSARVLCAVAAILLGNSANFAQALNLYSILGELSFILAENFKVFQDLKSRESDSVMYIKYIIIFPGGIN